MSVVYSNEELAEIVKELVVLPQETSWAEFKVNNEDPEAIGKYLSALSNSAALEERPRGYLLWGVRDVDHAIVGTAFDPLSAKVGGEDLVPWLTRLLTPKTHFEFDKLQINDKNVVLMSVAAASHQPVQFRGQEYIRIGSYVKDLRQYSDHERRLWQFFARTPFESGIALDRASEERILKLIDYAAYFELTAQPVPRSATEIIEALQSESLIKSSTGGKWSITNLGAILFAQDLHDFPQLRRKAPRVIAYDGRDRAASASEMVGAPGYASGFRKMLSHISARIPSKEVFEEGVRRDVSLYPEKAIRELVVNALIHQDFTISGSGPIVEIFSDRIEITNPGKSLVDVSRIIDAAPKSRNEDLASLARRMGLCEERGSGWDQVAALVEANELPAPLVEAEDEFTRVTVFEYRPLAMYSKEDRVRAVYFHACLRHVRHERTTNTSVRARFRINPNNVAKASRLIKDAVDEGVVVPYDPNVGAKAMSYVPFWASPTR